MVKRASIEFVEVSSPVTEAVTKFGGRPVWVSAPQWPLSRATEQPMQFIGQIALRDLFATDDSQMPLFPDEVVSVHGGMAYLFMTNGEDAGATWEPDGGENAVIVQPGDLLTPVQNITDGPLLYRMVPQPGANLLVPEPCEYAVHLICGKDPDLVASGSIEQQIQWEAQETEARRNYYSLITGNKIGGTPYFLQYDEFPGEDYHTLILQLDASTAPFHVNFGDAGIGYAFLSRDGRSGKFLWQCT